MAVQQSPVPTLRKRVISITQGVLLVTYAVFFIAFWGTLGMIRIGIRRWRMRLPPARYAYFDCHASGHQFGLSENVCEHCGAERFDAERLKQGTPRT